MTEPEAWPRRPWRVGDRVRVPISGWTGTVVAAPSRRGHFATVAQHQAHAYVRVRWDWSRPNKPPLVSPMSPTVLELLDEETR